MTNLSASYLGVSLKNPIIVASSNLTSSIGKLLECEKAGAGAVVLKSLFEEQILFDTNEMLNTVDYSSHPDAFDFLSGMGQNHYTDEYFKLLEDAKQKLSIPVIPSINCVSTGKWLSYAKTLQKLGADALELNVFIMPADVKKTSGDIEAVYLDIAKSIKKEISIPVAMKIGSHFSGLANMLKRLGKEGVDGFVLFNRFYRPDVDIEKEKLTHAKIFSAPEELNLSLQWIALLSGELSCDFAATTGIHTGEAVIKQLLVGAKAVQLCTALYKNGIGYISEVLKDLTAWMERHGYAKIEDFRGKLCQEKSGHPEAYERSQYVKALVGIS